MSVVFFLFCSPLYRWQSSRSKQRIIKQHFCTQFAFSSAYLCAFRFHYWQQCCSLNHYLFSLSSRQDENGKNHFHSRFELFGAENICSRRGAEFSCIFRVCRWMLFPSFYTTAGHNCPPSHAHHPQTTKASNFICGRNCFGPYDPPSRPALAHCSSDALSALATWQIESKMHQPLFLVPFAGLSSSRFSSFLFYFSLGCKTKPMQPVLSTAFSSNDQPPSSLGKCSSSQPCRLSYFAASRHVDFLTAQ